MKNKGKKQQYITVQHYVIEISYVVHIQGRIEYIPFLG